MVRTIILLGGPPQEFQTSRSPPSQLTRVFLVLPCPSPVFACVHVPLLE